MKKPDNTKKPVAKSLHTLTVMYQVARLQLRSCHGADWEFAEVYQVEQALDDAMRVLELAGREDPYGLRAKALKLLLADIPRLQTLTGTDNDGNPFSITIKV